MAQFRTTADLVDLVLTRAGETTNGNSSYETEALNRLNEVHFALICGGTIPLGKDSTVEIDEDWIWARARRPLILELQPKVSTGTVSLTQGDEAGTFSSAPASSLAGWYLRVQGRPDVLRIASHTAGATAFELDGHYPDDTGSGLNFEAYKLDYDLLPTHIVIDETNYKIQFQESAGTTLTGSLTKGTYTPAQLATHLKTVMDSTGGTPVYTISYDSETRKFTLASDRGGSSVFVLVGTGSEFSVHKTLGFDDENTTNAASVTSTYALGGIARLIEPFKIATSGGSLYGTDAESFQRDYPLTAIDEGTPNRFCVFRETEDGVFTVRMNAFPTEKMRIEVSHVAIPRDLKDNSTSKALVPRKFSDVLVDAATFYIMFMKSDSRATMAAELVKGKLKAMIAQHRGSLVRSGEHFGQIIPRREQLGSRKKLFPEDI